MEPEYMLVQQMQAYAQAMEENLRYVYDESMPYQSRQLALSYARDQGRIMEQLLKSYFVQIHPLEDRLRHAFLSSLSDDRD